MRDDFLYLPEQTISFRAFEEIILKTKHLFTSYQRVLIRSLNLTELYASILAARDLKISLYVCPSSVSEQQAYELARKWKMILYLGEERVDDTFAEYQKDSFPCLGIFSSATTGEPKVALHRWEAIESSSHYVPSELHQQTWLLTYTPGGYAGLQVFFSAWNSQGSIYYAGDAFKDICMGIVKNAVTIVSATPTFWKMLIAAWPPTLKVPQLLQATLGGEIVDQSVIDLISTFFQPRNLTHIYASTEAGTAIVVSDRFAGFPVSALDKQSKNGVRLRIVDDELQIFSPVGMENYVEKASPKTGEWIKTGDLVQVREERVYFLGRTDGRLNIGGRKVCPEEVEQALNSLHEIEDCLVYEKKSPIVGSLIAADVVIKASKEFSPMKIKQKLKNLLEAHKIPAIIRRVEHFAISSAGKKIRTTA